MARSLFIHTFGCQMNESDSQRMRESLGDQGWVAADTAAEADLILLNTSAIREKAEQKMYSALGRYREQKSHRGALIGVAGCVAQQEKGRILGARPLPWICRSGSRQPGSALPRIDAQLEHERKPIVQTGWMDSTAYLFPRADPEASRGKVSAFVTAMKGCDNVCSFCVVPHTRAVARRARPYAEIVAEIHALCQVGVREVTLIDQNVNSFARERCDFPSLLHRVGAIPGLARLRFTTSHPHDFSDALLRCFSRSEGGVGVLCPHLHLPVQCGSDEVLRRMRRDYTVAEYEARISSLRELAPQVALTSDIIVGFPGETDADFEQTLALVERIRYENLFSFVYSSRPHTAARLREREWGVVPEEIKIERLERLQGLQRRISAGHMAAVVRSLRSKCWWRAHLEPIPNVALATRPTTGPSISPEMHRWER